MPLAPSASSRVVEGAAMAGDSRCAPKATLKCGKSGKKQEKANRRLKREEQRAAAAAIEQTVRTAKGLANFFALATPNRRFRGGKVPASSQQPRATAAERQEFAIYDSPATALLAANAPLSDEIFNLTRENMKNLYNQVNFMEQGWDDDFKRRELTHEDARLLVVLTEPNETSAPVSRETDDSAALKDVSPDRLAGFLHYRFEVEEGTAVVYVYELQIKGAYQNMTLGRRLMLLLELAARAFNKAHSPLKFDKLMCTVIKENAGAVRFYKILCGFSTDESDPSNFVNEKLQEQLLHALQTSGKGNSAAAKMLERAQEEEEEDEECEYEILKKNL
ncbi:putative acetyltransferase domain-containing protein [Neospora caninum Liverpool]|uniref:N-alpha-acetyltransferase 40 n=1 Tax=Neospora caninum (strain Liverpool) TaxID=572307 RepID=F0VHS5_NEOCL|nr:putative acetyltransferase domain-containing protein [Neospora caninum Liverpool]CBZ53286.1 putative acetyltransferase domain-containing protein [Neospora caninum Liverpool]CEL67272.1 TPA: acetyltransferase domain-containing protein,putative [Neospora caninum Liverpool]|eukprot:XP_003883318.1 putative acetyltransferase domain-containing protein [Neospora caninum Liverpool]